MRIARDMELDVRETDLTRGMLYTCDEAFFTGTAAELTPIKEIDGREIGRPGEITKKIQEKFFDIIRGKDKNYEEWLDFI